ncbi:hypothetical protein MC885_005664 [Smutsia gigantea]|nr:hypothetical protein MC885_005664 [Smutsia gigantea]
MGPAAPTRAGGSPQHQSQLPDFSSVKMIQYFLVGIQLSPKQAFHNLANIPGYWPAYILKDELADLPESENASP